MPDRLHRSFPILVAAMLAACGGTNGDNGGAAPEPGGDPDAAAAQAAGDPAADSENTAAAAAFERKPAPEGAAAYIVSPADGDVVSNPVRVVFGLKGIGVAPAGVAHADTGHHHLLIDTEPPALDAPIPADDQHVHFGLGQTEAELTLPPGEHRLQLLLGDELHVPHDPAVLSEPIAIQVE